MNFNILKNRNKNIIFVGKYPQTEKDLCNYFGFKNTRDMEKMFIKICQKEGSYLFDNDSNNLSKYGLFFRSKNALKQNMENLSFYNNKMSTFFVQKIILSLSRELSNKISEQKNLKINDMHSAYYTSIYEILVFGERDLVGYNHLIGYKDEVIEAVDFVNALKNMPKLLKKSHAKDSAILCGMGAVGAIASLISLIKNCGGVNALKYDFDIDVSVFDAIKNSVHESVTTDNIIGVGDILPVGIMSCTIMTMMGANYYLKRKRIRDILNSTQKIDEDDEYIK